MTSTATEVDALHVDELRLLEAESVHIIREVVAELERPSHENAIFEIGGSDVLSYKTMMLTYARIRGLKRKLIVVPFFTPRLSSGWIIPVTQIHA